MIIQSSRMSLGSADARTTSTRTTATLRTWRPQGTTTRPAAPVPGAPAARSDRAVAHGGGERSGPGAAGGAPDPRGRFATMIAIIEWLTGEPVRVLDPAQLRGERGTREVGVPTRAAPQGGAGAEFTVTETVEEAQAVRFGARGSVVTEDGRRIDLEVDLELYRREAYSRTTRVTAGEAPVQDPLVLSFGTVPAISDRKVSLDLDLDGTPDRVPFVSAGNAYLVLDADGDGTVDDGRELFGPTTGDGFAELAAHDADGNGWIDEADPVFARLRLWSDAGGSLSTLAERGVGAIGLDRVATPFLLTAGDGVARLQSTGVWIGQDATVGTIHRIDLST